MPHITIHSQVIRGKKNLHGFSCRSPAPNRPTLLTPLKVQRRSGLNQGKCVQSSKRWIHKQKPVKPYGYKVPPVRLNSCWALGRDARSGLNSQLLHCLILGKLTSQSLWFPRHKTDPTTSPSWRLVSTKLTAEVGKTPHAMPRKQWMHMK